MSHRTFYKDFYAVQTAITSARGGGMSYSQIARLYGVPPIWVWHVERGTFPKRADIRLAFGVQPYSVTAEMFHAIVVCDHDGCDDLYIPNHPKRRYCFKCSPYRGRKERR